MIFGRFFRPRFLRVFLPLRLVHVKVHRLEKVVWLVLELNRRNRFVGDFNFGRWIRESRQQRRCVQAEGIVNVFTCRFGSWRKTGVQSWSWDDGMMQDVLVFDMRCRRETEWSRTAFESHSFVANRHNCRLNEISEFSDRIVDVLGIDNDFVFIEVNSLPFWAFFRDKSVVDAQSWNFPVMRCVVFSQVLLGNLVKLCNRFYSFTYINIVLILR